LGFGFLRFVRFFLRLELVGWHTAKIGDRWAALEPLRQGVRYAFGRFAKDIARGLRIRCAEPVNKNETVGP
jgi:hypothetical protein